MRLAIHIGPLVMHAELARTPTAAALEADCRQVVDPGSVCFWTEGNAIALPFGRTPIATDARPKLASPCNVPGTLIGDARALASVRPGEKIRVCLA